MYSVHYQPYAFGTIGSSQLCAADTAGSFLLRRPLPAGQDQWLERSAIAALYEFLGVSWMPVPVAATLS